MPHEEDNPVNQFALPFRLNANGSDVEYIPEDSEEEIRSCVEALVRTPLGFHDEDPDLGGSPDLFEEGGPDLNDLHHAVSLWEPRADALIEQDHDLLDDMVANIRVEASVSQHG